MQLQHSPGVEGPWDRAGTVLSEQFPRQFCARNVRPNQIAREDAGHRRFTWRGGIWSRRWIIRVGLGLVMLCAAASSLQAQSHAGICPPLTRPLLPSDDRLMREFADLLRDEFEQYLSEVTEYFNCLDEERDRAWREAAEVTAQYGAFLEALRAAPP
ncbi:MAG: hypothetical protein EA386_15965 [Rhodobacteraceae bacterium]|nr:MAG: hypothetical protein EA386_15965 [Paracoccaceae bacterium]